MIPPVVEQPIDTTTIRTDDNRTMMTMVSLKRSNHSSPPHKLKSNSWDPQHYSYYERDEEDELLPDMIESPSSTSGSHDTMSSGEALHQHAPSGSNPPPYFSSSSRMQERFSATLIKARTQRRRSRRHMDTGIDAESIEPSNSSILKGADIIKRQLSREDSPLRAAHPPQEPPNSHRRSTGDWDPWKTHSNTVRGRILDYSRDDQFKAKTKPTRNHRKHEILSGGDDYFQVRNKSQTSSKDDESKPKEATTTSTSTGVTRTMVDNTTNCMVKRVSELDDSTFASSTSGNGGYLPKQLLTCGGLNNALSSCNQPQQFLPGHLLQQPQGGVATAKNALGSQCNSSLPDEELETSTLDFLANLHCKEEDLNFVFSDSKKDHQEERTNNKNKNNNKNNNRTNPNREVVTSSSFVTAASTPFETMLSARSTLFEQLSLDPAYQHALKAGTLWQSLCSQHVRFPAHWWDAKAPIGPPLGSSKKRPWSYLGRHRVQGDPKLHKLIGNRSSSGRILLHVLVRDEVSGQVIEDIACGCFHPNARGIRTTPNFDPKLEDCRDVWIAHRRRYYDTPLRPQSHNDESTKNDFSWMTTLESLLIHQNKGKVHQSPLGAQGDRHSINNRNLRTVFGSKPPVFTVFCSESELYELFEEKLDGSIPASVALLRHYLRFQMK